MATITTSTTPSTPTVDVKHFLKSKTFWSAIVVVITSIGHIVQTGQIGPDDLVAIMGAIGCIYGRAVAQGPLTASSGS